jgi:hypothetical protein
MVARTTESPRDLVQKQRDQSTMDGLAAARPHLLSADVAGLAAEKDEEHFGNFVVPAGAAAKVPAGWDYLRVAANG